MTDIVEKPVQRRSEASSTTRANDVPVVDFADCDQCTQYPNRWSGIREHITAPAAEFMGAFILCLFGCGGNCQTNLSANKNVSASPQGVMLVQRTALSSNICWALGLSLGVWISANYSGGHVNPAVTIASATVRGFPWKKVPIYILAQVLGALCGAGVVYATYYHAINIVEGGSNIRTIAATGDLFGTYAADYLTSVSAFFAEFIGAAMLLTGIFMATDKKNGPLPSGVLPLAIFFTVLAISSSLGMDTGAALNPARDLGPRILTAMVGYGREVFTFRNQYWLWCPILGPIFGMIMAALFYDAMLYKGPESIFNKPTEEAERHHLRSCAQRTNGLRGVADSV
ncbi:major intrinsic protein superfamily membrane channel protein [Suillus paluster]|uniref:major intrinsic protein superfamily membrane channel protein n=1 Tax=Suillus paluster TaxID=48578 RepID=UPI001B87A0B5|nr:major intrinsic protein superfamily membrane channel protein [Suillus paluster]KAG1745874.1 major intrinsic protein superfamily membrane channel protein [Suillus paluster]